MGCAMFRVLLVFALLAVPALAAPRLKDRKPAPDPEAARIAALKAKYDEIRKSGTREEQVLLDIRERNVQMVIQQLDRLEGPPGVGDPHARKQALEDRIRQRPDMSDLYEIALYDRKKAAGKK
jgi:hypothetical protein